LYSVVLVCAFSTEDVTIISLAVEAFLSAIRTRSNDIVIVLVKHAEDIEKIVRRSTLEKLQPRDNFVVFVEGLSNSKRDLKVCIE
jgi:hypothetical protein